jgi:hypothetical protein
MPESFLPSPKRTRLTCLSNLCLFRDKCNKKYHGVDVIAGPVILGFLCYLLLGEVFFFFFLESLSSFFVDMTLTMFFDINSMIDHKKVLINIIRSSHYYQGHRHQLDFQYPQFSPLCYTYSCLLDTYLHSVSSDYIKLEASPDVLSSLSFKSG